MWKMIPGYKWPYRIDENSCVQKRVKGKWFTKKPYLHGNRACVKMRSVDNKSLDVPVVWLMADAFMGGLRLGCNIVHKNGYKLDCSLRNLEVISKQESGKRYGGKNRRIAVAKVDMDGNVVEIYSSGREAARKNYLSQSSVWLRCKKKIAYPFDLDGFDYIYADEVVNV